MGKWSCCKIQNNHCSPPRAMLLGGKANFDTKFARTQEMVVVSRWDVWAFSYGYVVIVKVL